jgi:hypothetical protein
LAAAKGAIFPEPEATSPMPGVELIQLYVVVPEVLMVVKAMAAVDEPLHTTWLTGIFTCPSGFTVIVKLCDGPLQITEPLSKCGVTVIVATSGVVPVLIAEKGAMSPEPDATSPMPVSVFVHV